MHKKNKLKVALAQISCKLTDIDSNLEKHISYVEKAIAAEADLVLFPELSLTGYSVKDAVFDVAMSYNDIRLKPLYEASKKISICFGFVELTDNFEAKNTNLFLENGELIYSDQQNIITRDINYRDCDVTKVTEKTKKLMLFIDGTDATSNEEVKKIFYTR